MAKTLADWEIGDGAAMMINDDVSDLVINVQIIHGELDEEEVPEGFKLGFGEAEKKSEDADADAAAGGGQKRSAVRAPPAQIRSCPGLDLVLILACAVPAQQLAFSLSHRQILTTSMCVAQDEDDGEPSAKRARA